MNAEEIIKKLKADKRNIVVSNVVAYAASATPKGKYTQISLSLDTALSRIVHVTDNDGVDTLETVKVPQMYTSEFPLSALFKQTEGCSFLGKHIVKFPASSEVLLDHAVVDIIQQFVPANTEYVNPFTTQEDNEPVVFAEDKYVNHIISIRLAKGAQKYVDRVADKIMFSNDEN